MIDGSFVNEIIEHAASPELIEVAGVGERLIAPNNWVDITPKRPAVEPLKVGTLTGFVEYVTANKDALDSAGLVVHVKDPGTVVLRGKLAGAADHYARQHYIVATIDLVGQPFTFGTFLDAETFFVALQTQFVRTEAVEKLLELIASIRESSVRETVDDGVAQEVRTGKGVALVGSQRLPNPISLAPFRTFREIDQPASAFVLRARQGQGDKPHLALFEADGGRWKLTALSLVRSWLAGKLTLSVIA